jgi:hypothetical protein
MRACPPSGASAQDHLTWAWERIEELQLREEQLFVALEQAKELFDVALPQFNWGASALSAEAIKLLNEVPTLVNSTLLMKKPG